MIVSANAVRRRALERPLRQAGFQVRDAAAGAEGLRLTTHMPSVILLDLQLPDMSGLEVCRRLKSQTVTAGIPVLHLSDAAPESWELADHLEHGDEAFLTHPVNDMELLASVRSLLRGRQAHSQFGSFLEAAPDAVVIIDRVGRIVRVNGQTEKIFGYAREELVGHEVEMLMPARFRDRHRGERADFMVHSSMRPMGSGMDLWGVRKDGSEFPVEISLNSLPGHESLLVAAIVRDVTERRRLERELKVADRKKNEFLATLAHELRNPLASIRNAVEVMQLTGPEAAEREWAVDLIDLQARFMTRLVDDLLDVSRISQGKLQFCMEPIDLAEVVQRAVEMSRPQIEDCGHNLTITLPTQPIRLNADLTRLTQVFSNLLDNAAKYSEQGGRIWLSAERREGEVVVSVKDAGIGIPAEMLPLVFDLYAQVDQARNQSQGGLGIGLSLVKGVVENHGGTVEAHSGGPGMGSEFLVRLPLAGEVPGPAGSSSGTSST